LDAAIFGESCGWPLPVGSLAAFLRSVKLNRGE
jgi:hypothetical protein